MSTVLVLTSSATGDASVSSQLVQETVEQIKAHDPGVKIVAHDLGANPLPHLVVETTAAIRGAEPASPEAVGARALSDALVKELAEADTLVIGAPMYNFAIPSTLKAWFDHVLRAGVTFRYSENGPEGLMKGKRAILVLTRGGFYSEGPLQALDSQEPHLRNMLAFIGITDVSVVYAEKLGFGPEAREAAISAARVKLRQEVESRPLQAA